MPKTVALFRLLFILLFIPLILAACGQEPPQVEWELTIDGDVNQTVTYTYRELADMERTTLDNILTQNPNNPNERASWEGVRLLRVFKKPGGVEYAVNWYADVTLADGSTHRMSLADLRGAIIALQDGEGNWLAETDTVPLRLIPPNLPSDQWLPGPVRITIDAPQNS